MNTHDLLLVFLYVKLECVHPPNAGSYYDTWLLKHFSIPISNKKYFLIIKQKQPLTQNIEEKKLSRPHVPFESRKKD